MIDPDTLNLINAISTGLAAIGGIGGTIAAVWAVRVSRESISAAARSTRLETTFEHIREIEARIRALRTIDAKAAYAALLDLSRENKPLTQDAATAESFLNGFEVLAFAILRGDVDRELATRFLASIDAGMMQTYVRTLRACCGGNPHLYENLEKHLESMLADASSAPPKPKPQLTDAIEPRVEKAALPAATAPATPIPTAGTRREVERADSHAEPAASTDENADVVRRKGLRDDSQRS